MKIAKLRYSNLKGRTADLSLAPFTIISGQNGTGKTGVLDALALATLGHAPRLGKTNQATADLASKFPMEVSASTETLTFGFRLTSGKTLKGERFGDDPPVMPAILFQPSIWLEASPAVRQKLIRDHIRGLTSEMGQIWDKLVAGLTASDDALIAVNAMNIESVEERVGELQKQLEAARKDENALAKRFRETIQGLETLNLMAADVEEMPDIEGINQQIQERLKLEGESKAKLATIQGSIQSKKDRIDQITNEIADLPKEPSEPLAKLQSRLTAAKANLEAVQVKLGELKSAQERIAQRSLIEKEIHEMRLTLSRPPTLITEEDKTEAALALSAGDRRKLEDQVGQLNRERDLLIRARDLAAEKHKEAQEHAATCPHCGSSSDHWTRKPWETTAENLAQAQKAAEVLSGRCIEAQKKLDIDTPRQEAASKVEHERKRVEEDDHTLTMIDSREKLLAEYGSVTIDTDASMKLVEERGNIRSDIDETAELISFYEQRTRIPSLLHEQEKLTGEIEALKADEQRMNDGLTWDAEEITNMRQQLERAKSQQTEIDAARANKAQLAKAQEELGESEERLEKIAKDIDTCKTANEQIAQCNIQPVIDMANEFLSGVFDWKLDKSGDSLGYWAGMTWVPMKTFSGAQTKIVLAAIQAALAADSPFKLLMLDEAVCIDRARSGAFYENVMKAVKKGTLDQAIILDMDTPEKLIESLSTSPEFTRISFE